MVHPRIVEDQLKAIGAKFRFFGRPEIRELSNILTPGEVIAQAVNGYYEGGLALLCVTDQRLLLVDRKMLFMTIEDIRFDMVSEVDFSHGFINATARVYTPTKSLVFTSWSHERLRKIVQLVQERVLQARQLAQITPQQQFAQYAQAQLNAVSSATGARVQHHDHVSLTPALAQTAIHGASMEEHRRFFGFTGSNFVSPPSRNPFVKSPMKSFRKFRNM
jgi:Bacterial PH domain